MRQVLLQALFEAWASDGPRRRPCRRHRVVVVMGRFAPVRWCYRCNRLMTGERTW